MELKESINNVVRGALQPLWKDRKLTAEQYESINRNVSRMIYEHTDPATGANREDAKRDWEKMATREVARAVAGLKA